MEHVEVSRRCRCGQAASANREEVPVRWIHLAIVVLFIAAIVIFAIQNMQVIRMAFLGFSVRAPIALLVIGVYVLGAITGGSLFALIRRSMQAARSVRVAA
jgi:lipopolysaccharide assembly protein A